MKSKILGVLQRIGRSFMLPIALLPIAGFFLGIGRSLTNETTIQTLHLDAFLGQNTSFNGTLVFEGIVRVDGNFEGNVKSNDTLVIAESGNVNAQIEAGIVKISGTFDGLVVAKNKVELYKPAVVSGTIRTPVLKMEEGVIFNGTLEMDNGRNKPLTGKKEEDK